MATYADNLATIRDNYAAALAADSVSPQPSYSIDGKSVSRNEWRDSLLRQIKELNELILLASPYEYHVRPYT